MQYGSKLKQFLFLQRHKSRQPATEEICKSVKSITLQKGALKSVEVKIEF